LRTIVRAKSEVIDHREENRGSESREAEIKGKRAERADPGGQRVAREVELHALVVPLDEVHEGG
jgi:hypothetical protein